MRPKTSSPSFYYEEARELDFDWGSFVEWGGGGGGGFVKCG